MKAGVRFDDASRRACSTVPSLTFDHFHLLGSAFVDFALDLLLALRILKLLLAMLVFTFPDFIFGFGDVILVVEEHVSPNANDKGHN